MKVMIVSDIHGDINVLEWIIYKVNNDHIDKLIILGDFCGYGDDSIDIAKRLNTIRDKIICVRGNCDTDKFIECLDIDMPIYQNININGLVVTLTHGHIYNGYYLPKNCSDILISGHTHRSLIDNVNNVLCLNPGSIAKPRDGIKSYILINGYDLYIKDINENIIDSCNLKRKIV